VITPRRIRLLRAPDLAGYRSAIVHLVRGLDAAAAADTFVLVPTSAAADQLMRTLGGRQTPIGTRADLYANLIDRLEAPLRTLTDFEREAMLASGARDAEDSGAAPPFHVRPALIAEMLALYDHVRRLGRTIDDFDRLLTGELEPAAESDRGAAQLLQQTRFLTAAYRAYDGQLAQGAVDEHGARQRIVSAAATRPLRHLVIAVGDRAFDSGGFWPADASMFTTVPGLERIDVVSTAGLLDSGYDARLRLAFVELEEAETGQPQPAPALIRPNEDVAFAYRDREDELEGVARRVIGDPGSSGIRDQGAALERVGLVVAKPLPYLYLAREVFGGAGLPYQAPDTLPLAAEPYAAAVDLVLECVSANFTRRALVALLRSPHFTFASEGVAVGRDAVAALDSVLAEQRYLGGLDRLRALVAASTGREQPAAAASLAAAEALLPLSQSRPMVEQAELLRGFLETHDRDHDDPSTGSGSPRAESRGDRRRRARGAVVTALVGLATAYRRHDPAATGTASELSSALKRWLGAQTFAVPTGDRGVAILDAQAARFADLDDVQIMGLVEGEWPERPRRNVFYPRSLIAQLEPSRPERVLLHEERDQLRYARAMFRDLLGLARNRVRLSTFALESEAVVEPSMLIEDVAAFGVPTQRATDRPDAVFAYERLAHEPLTVESPWARLRARQRPGDAGRFAGDAGPWVLPRVSVSRLERYMKCPFQFFVSNVLQVAEEPEDETSRSPLERGRFLHELFETFFHEWQSRGHGRITAATMAAARTLFDEIAGPALRSLPPAEAGLERARLFGSAVGSGIVDRVFAMEAQRGTAIRQRFMEYELDDAFTFMGEDGTAREIRLRAKIDRVDLLDDGTFRLIDYKTKYVPDRREALQLPVYSACVRTALKQTHGRDIAPGEAMYLSFEGPRAVVPLDPSALRPAQGRPEQGRGTAGSGSPRAKSRGEERGSDFDDLITAAGHRLVAALDGIAAGHFPPRPETKNLCTMCSFTAVCRYPGRAAEGSGITRAADGAEGSVIARAADLSAVARSAKVEGAAGSARAAESAESSDRRA
jgi:RecB family exonuclease